MVNAYDEVLYPGYPRSQTHPDRLATLATLFGMKPAPVERCRVLELACGDGGNLIPMALGLPESEFVGIDSAACPVAQGRTLSESLGLKNITLRQLDIMEVASDFGQFDYIIIAGLYSWVPPPVQDKILVTCKAHLAPNGVAFVSYNTYPGSHLRQMVREMMLFHVRYIAESQQQINQARALVKFLAESQPDADAFRMFLKSELQRVLEHRDGSLYHDDLAEINLPVYFYQFIEHAAQHGLQYLSEADFFEMQDRIFPPHVSDTLRLLANNQVMREQYLDFLKCRKFRQTLLCHQDVLLDRALNPEHMRVFYLASSARPVSPKPDINSTAVEEFRSAKGATLSTNHPLAKSAILELSEVWPQALHFNELLARARSRIGLNSTQDDASLAQDARLLGEIVLKMYAANMIELHVHVPHFVLEVSERPVASPLARLQSQNGNVVTNLRHASIEVVDTLARHLLQVLDGTRDHAALLNELAGLVESGVLITHPEGETARDTQEALKNLPDELENNLAQMAQLALLVA